MPIPRQRLAEFVADVSGGGIDGLSFSGVPMSEPARIESAMVSLLTGRFAVTGTYERRLVFAESPHAQRWQVADLSGRALGDFPWPAWTRERITVESPRSWRSVARITPDGIRRLLQPRVLLVALYHPEWFPLPRFPLGISDVARAARATLVGHVRLMDMQLGVSLADIQDAVLQERPDIVGISATFGQHDLMVGLLDWLAALESSPLTLAGGSLTARNEHLLLRRYPRLLVARGAGETTMQDVLAYWHGDLSLRQVRGVGYVGRTRDATPVSIEIRRNAGTANRVQADALPELDLLAATFAHHGVAQLEMSRGCTSSCSFCPRGHKGTWAGVVPEALPELLTGMREVFDRYPAISRTLYLVDEEFIGRGADAVPRALAVADVVHRAGFRWESSCRVDQIVTGDGDRAWHCERAAMFRALCAAGMRRMLFGVESGVTSVLERFNKETTGEQNAIAVQTLSALDVPTRFTYITFDPLMSLAELRATYEFQGRTDLLLRPMPAVDVVDIVDGVRDPAFVNAHRSDQPFYAGISYMLVSMECLIGSAYTKRVASAGLTGVADPSMGRIDAAYLDWRIGRCAHHAQRWIDRHFALDYTFKSLEKFLDGAPRRAVRDARVLLKAAAYDVLGDMLGVIDQYPLDGRQVGRLNTDLVAVLDARLDGLRDRMAATVDAVGSVLPGHAARLLVDEYGRWDKTAGWRLINLADTCAV